MLKAVIKARKHSSCALKFHQLDARRGWLVYTPQSFHCVSGYDEAIISICILTRLYSRWSRTRRDTIISQKPSNPSVTTRKVAHAICLKTNSAIHSPFNASAYKGFAEGAVGILAAHLHLDKGFIISPTDISMPAPLRQ